VVAGIHSAGGEGGDRQWGRRVGLPIRLLRHLPQSTMGAAVLHQTCDPKPSFHPLL